METIERVKIAFRKLKAHVYFDKTALPLRDRVVRFEASSDFDKKLQDIADAFDQARFGKETLLMADILASIGVMQFPKELMSDQGGKNIAINIGRPQEKPVIKEVQEFIDMDVCGHIVGILWIMAFGWLFRPHPAGIRMVSGQ